MLWYMSSFVAYQTRTVEGEAGTLYMSADKNESRKSIWRTRLSVGPHNAVV